MLPDYKNLQDRRSAPEILKRYLDVLKDFKGVGGLKIEN